MVTESKNFLFLMEKNKDYAGIRNRLHSTLGAAMDGLTQLKLVLEQIPSQVYNQKLPLLHDTSIGAHVRHILEFFNQLIDGYESGIIQYDKRERNEKLETDLPLAISTIVDIMSGIDKAEKYLSLSTTYNDYNHAVPTSYERELIYNIEHCIHHQAIIKIALKSLKLDVKNESFGLAKSTLNFRDKCVQ